MYISVYLNRWSINLLIVQKLPSNDWQQKVSHNWIKNPTRKIDSSVILTHSHMLQQAIDSVHNEPYRNRQVAVSNYNMGFFVNRFAKWTLQRAKFMTHLQYIAHTNFLPYVSIDMESHSYSICIFHAISLYFQLWYYICFYHKPAIKFSLSYILSLALALFLFFFFSFGVPLNNKKASNEICIKQRGQTNKTLTT